MGMTRMTVKECVICDAEFEARIKTQKYCSPNCRQESKRRFNREYARQPKVKDMYKKYRQENPEMYRKAAEKYRTNNPEKWKETMRKSREKTLSTPAGRTNNRIRCNLRKHLKLRRMTKGGKTFTLLGYTGEELAKHLESQFTDGMSWDNMKDWHIDHIRPIASFNYTTTECEDFKKCWALNNLQPLWATDNISKGDKWDGITNA